MNLKELGKKIGLKEEEYRDLLEIFLYSGSADIDRMQRAFQSDNVRQVARSAHTLNGAAGNLGIQSIHEVARRIEIEANHNRLDTVSDEIVSLKKLFDDIAERIRHSEKAT